MLMRRDVNNSAAARDRIRVLRCKYRMSMRRERSYYWEERLKPQHYPLEFMTNIQDGATQMCVRVQVIWAGWE